MKNANTKQDLDFEVNPAMIGSFDNVSRWYPSEDVAEYFQNLRAPSRAWPYSYYKACFTKKFKKWLLENKPAIAMMFSSK